VQKESEESGSDFADDDEDSDDDYQETTALRPWQKKAAAEAKSRLDQVEESDDDEMADADDGRPRKTVVDADLEDYQKITLPRRRLARWCNEPFFKDAVLNCFVKLFIGENEQRKRCYRLCKIVGIERTKEGDSYQLPAVKKEKAVCN
jgi:RNA polymerase-associated protein RTF1